MTAPEIEKAAREAGFELTDATDPDRLVFTRGPHTLIVNADATCICHSDVRGRRTMHGYTSRIAFGISCGVPKGIGISEPNKGSPFDVMAVLKQRVSRALRGKKGRANAGQRRLWEEPS